MTVDIYQPAQVAVPDTHDTDSWVTICSDVIKLANVIHDTEFVPKDLRGSAPAVAAAILAGREMGLGPMTSLANIHVISGRPSQSALLMRALVQSRGHKWEDGDVTDTRAVVRGCRRGESKWTEVVFTADQAKRAGIDLGKYPADKLYARATARLARRKFADVVAGMPYTPDEVEDGEDAADAAGTVTETAAVNGNGHAPASKPAARTARRRTAAASTPGPTTAATADGAASTAGPAAPRTAPGGSSPEPPQPPLPGEDGAEEAAGPGWVGLIVKHFERLGYDDRDVRLAMTAMIAGREQLASTKDLTEAEAKKVLDTLARCKDAERLTAVLDGIEGGSDD
jgi:hypothetical protein